MATNIKTLNTNEKDFFTLWLEFLKPYHKMAPKEIEVMSVLLRKRHEFSKKTTDDSLLDKLLFSRETRAEIRDEMNYETYQVFNNMVTGLRKKGVIVGNTINKGLIPRLEGNNFKLIFNFNINES